jgi:hypothetical protein
MILTSASVFAQAGMNGGTHNVTNESTFSYGVNEGGADTDVYKWEVFSDAVCTAPVTAGVGTYTFNSGDDTREVNVTWNNAPTVGSTTTYYLRVSQKGAHDCYTYQTIEIIITNKDDNAGLNFAFVGASQQECSVDQSGTDIPVTVTLTGTSLVHAAGKAVKVKYAVDGTDKGWISVGTTVGNPNEYQIIFPAASFVNPDVNADHNFVITVSQMENGTGGTIKDITPAATYTIEAWGLPSMSGITIK